ncbi:unnamed protein product [Linum trigynum]|uniref:Uncharacterized protein n=1 Tax=Linum trigynum TaxID=586398 RepID=A0AAV2FUG4_9ROSI
MWVPKVQALGVKEDLAATIHRVVAVSSKGKEKVSVEQEVENMNSMVSVEQGQASSTVVNAWVDIGDQVAKFVDVVKGSIAENPTASQQLDLENCSPMPGGQPPSPDPPDQRTRGSL